MMAEDLGIVRCQRLGVSRKIDFGNDLDVALRSIGDDFPDVVLGIETAIAFFPGIIGRHQHFVTAAPGTFLRQFGILLDLDPPAVVIDQMPVELVDLMVSQPIEMAEDIGLVKEVARDIEHAAAPFEAGLVLDLHARNLPLPDEHGIRTFGAPVHLCGQHLKQGLDGIELAGTGRRTDQDPGRGDLDGVSLLGERFDADKLDAAVAFAYPAVSQRIEYPCKMGLQITCVERIASDDPDIFVEGKVCIRIAAVLHADGLGNKIDAPLGKERRLQQNCQHCKCDNIINLHL